MELVVYVVKCVLTKYSGSNILFHIDDEYVNFKDAKNFVLK